MKRVDGGHVIMESSDCACRTDGGCSVCDGGLAFCPRCGGGETDLAEPCASRRRRLRLHEYVVRYHRPRRDDVPFYVLSGETRVVDGSMRYRLKISGHETYRAAKEFADTLNRHTVVVRRA